jgi:hypothetical protein
MKSRSLDINVALARYSKRLDGDRRLRLRPVSTKNVAQYDLTQVMGNLI